MEPHDYKNGDVVRWDNQLWRVVVAYDGERAHLWHQFAEATVAIEELEFVGIDTLSDRAKKFSRPVETDTESDHWASWKKPKKPKKTKPEPKKDSITTKDLIKREAERLKRDEAPARPAAKMRSSVVDDGEPFKRSGPIPHREPKI